MNTLYYFGTSLTTSGHYFWELGEHMKHPDWEIMWDWKPEAMPFNPEENFSDINGAVKFYQQKGFSIFAIMGSCRDTRGHSKSVFFVKELLRI